MAKYKCKMCGAPLDVTEGQTVVSCDFCQSKQTVANANDERKEILFNRANSIRTSCDFDKAILSYQSILSIFPNEPEAHWGLCLCKYGIEYVDDPVTKNKIPTIHRVSYDSILKDSDYLSALAYADAIAKEEYQEEAKQIADIQKNILSISQKEDPFDIFICYKETTETGKRTHDSVLAQEVYSNLTEKGYKVFFSRITLENKLGSMYEPYIFAALNSAKIMLVFGTKKEYFEAVWVKNEWSRFIDMMKTRPDHYLIPCYRDMDAYEMPEQFLAFQGQDMSKLGFMQDLMRGVDKIMGRIETPKVYTETKIIQSDVNIISLLKRAEILIGDGEFSKADEVLERALDNDPTNSQAYLLKLLVELKFTSIEELKTLDENLESNSNFKKAYKFGDDQQKNILNSIIEAINERIEQVKFEKQYEIAIAYKYRKRFFEAKDAFSEISGFKDSDKQALECVKEVYNQALSLKEEKSFSDAIDLFQKIKEYEDSEFQIADCKELINKELYEDACQLKNSGYYIKAAEIFASLHEYQDAENQVHECYRLKDEFQKESIYVKCLFNKEINSESDYYQLKKVCQQLNTIKGYKDADALLARYEGILADYDTKLAKKKEEAAKAKAERIKKAKTISLFSCLGAIVITAILLLTFLFFVPLGRQNNICNLINAKRYDEAIALIEQTNDFGDSSNLLAMCNAGKEFENHDYEAGIDYIYNIGGTVDVNYDGNGGTPNISNEQIKKTKGYIENDPNKTADKNGYKFTNWVLTDYAINAKKHRASINLKAQYITKAEAEEEDKRRLGITPTISKDGKTITYGLYPQTNINDSSLISSLNSLTTPEANGWYLYDGNYYAKVNATPYGSSYTFDNGITIERGVAYWFKCEPIVWNVLSVTNGEYYIVSSILLDAHYYYKTTENRTIDGQTIYANNSKYSDIRTWLNEDFYNSAFALGNDYIQTTTVDNSASTTNSSSNIYTCNDTEDKVFLPSYQDYKNSSYGFSTSTPSTDTRYCKTTDWARASGAYYYTSSLYLYNGFYWTRSPESNGSYYAWGVYFDGRLEGHSVNRIYNSVRPAITIKLA